MLESIRRTVSDYVSLRTLTSQENLVLYTAVGVGLVAAYGFSLTFGFEGSFLLLLTVANSVPRAYSGYWEGYDTDTKAVLWALTACLVTGAEFTALYLLSRRLVSASPLASSIGAFVLVHAANLVWLKLYVQR